MLYSQGIRLESLGIPTRDGTPVESDPRAIWQIFGENWYLFRGTPTGAWLEHELHEVFGIRQKLSGETAQEVYDEIAERLATPEFLPRALFERFDIEQPRLVAGRDDVGAAIGVLEHHQAIRDSGWQGRVIPCFRPDAVFRISLPGWRGEIDALSRVSGIEVGDFVPEAHAALVRHQPQDRLAVLGADADALVAHPQPRLVAVALSGGDHGVARGVGPVALTQHAGGDLLGLVDAEDRLALVGVPLTTSAFSTLSRNTLLTLLASPATTRTR